VAVEANSLCLPVDVLGVQVRHVGLRATNVPAKLIKRPALRVRFLGNDGLVFQGGDRTLLAEAHLGPLLLGEHRPGQPVHIEGEIVNPPQEDIRGHGAGVQHFQELRRMCLDNWQVADDVKSFVLHRPRVADERRTGLGPGHLVHRGLPGALGNLAVARGQICPCDVEIEDGLAVGFVLGMQQREGFAFVFGPQAGLFAGRRVFAVVNLATPEEDESLFHTGSLNSVNQSVSSAFCECEFRRVSVEFCQVVANCDCTRHFTDSFTDSGHSNLRFPLYLQAL